SRLGRGIARSNRPSSVLVPPTSPASRRNSPPTIHHPPPTSLYLTARGFCSLIRVETRAPRAIHTRAPGPSAVPAEVGPDQTRHAGRRDVLRLSRSRHHPAGRQRAGGWRELSKRPQVAARGTVGPAHAGFPARREPREDRPADTE